MKIMEEVKEHPYIAAGGVFVIGVILIVILFSGNKTPTVVQSAPVTDTTGATQLAMTQLSTQAAVAIEHDQSLTQQNTNSAMVQAAQITAGTQQNHDLLASQTALGVANIDAGAMTGVSTINAQVLMHNSDNAVTMNKDTQNEAALAAQTNAWAAVTINKDTQNEAALAAQTGAAEAITINKDNNNAANYQNYMNNFYGTIRSALVGNPGVASTLANQRPSQ